MRATLANLIRLLGPRGGARERDGRGRLPGAAGAARQSAQPGRRLRARARAAARWPRWARPSSGCPRCRSPAPTARARRPRWPRRSCAPPAGAPGSTHRRTCAASPSASAIAGIEVDGDRLARLDAAIVATGVPLTYFEVATVLAFQVMAEEQVEIGVLETGLGGRLDAVTVCAPLATAITSIGWDHMDFLGTSLASIAREKAGILKPGVPCFLARVPAEADAVIDEVARAVGAPLLALRPGVRHRARLAGAGARGRAPARERGARGGAGARGRAAAGEGAAGGGDRGGAHRRALAGAARAGGDASR